LNGASRNSRLHLVFGKPVLNEQSDQAGREDRRVASSLTLATPLQAQESKGWDRTVRVADYLEPTIRYGDLGSFSFAIRKGA